ncbi:MAG: aromatic ring-hydroxylating dioxygenase subunit alpha [Candidatus Margulisbacteria bacterium]|nr:aromatic ring-hydroxylating dioxygenase subunit alpha [Candidatus Margulisiibacteriota bacterium]
MRPQIKPEAYWNPDIAQHELTHVFLASWIFAGVVTQLPNHHDFMTVELAHLSLIIQNFDGEIKAFENVCTHRFSRIHTECRGNRPMICPYHAWSFNKHGMPQGIPQKPHFGDLDPETLTSLKLKEWEVGIVGKCIFVRHPNADTSEKPSTFLGAYFNLLEKMSQGLDTEIDYNPLDIGCNWKIAVENTLESYHVAPIHAKTFYKLGAIGEKFEITDPHSSWLATLNEKTVSQWQRVKKNYREMQYEVGGYLHVFLYPNMTVATTHGGSFSVQRFLPIAPDRTRFESWVFDCKTTAQSETDKTILSMMNKSIIDFNRSVFSEDKTICEQVQKGATQATCPGLLSDIEDRVLTFQRSYQKSMSVTKS